MFSKFSDKVNKVDEIYYKILKWFGNILIKWN